MSRMASNGSPKAVLPSEVLLGPSYSELSCIWMRWLVSLNPDVNNNGPIVFLRGVDNQPNPASGSYMGFVRVGAKKLKAYDNQYFFWPSIGYYVDERHHSDLDTEQKKLTYLTNLMSYGVAPTPNQVTIDGETVVPDSANVDQFRIVSTEFDLTIPDGTYGSDVVLGPILDEPFRDAGTWRCVVGGYFFLIPPLTSRDEPYVIGSTGQGELGYKTYTFCEIQVQEAQATTSRPTGPKPAIKGLGNDVRTLLQNQAKTDKEVKDRLKVYEKSIKAWLKI